MPETSIGRIGLQCGMFNKAVHLKMAFEYMLNSSVVGALPQPKKPQTNA